MGRNLVKGLLALLFAAFVLLPMGMWFMVLSDAFNTLGLYRFALLVSGQILAFSIVCGFFAFGWRTRQLWIMFGALLAVGGVEWTPETGMQFLFAFNYSEGGWTIRDAMGWIRLSAGEGTVHGYGFQIPLFTFLVLPWLFDKESVAGRLAGSAAK